MVGNAITGAILCTTAMETCRVYRFDGITVDLDAMRLRRDGKDIAVEPKSFYVIELLILNRSRVVHKEEIFRAVWKDVVVTDNALTRTMTQIRKALNDDPRHPRFIETVPTVGYRFIGALVPANAEPGSSRAGVKESAGSGALFGRTLRIALVAGCLCIAVAAAWWWRAHAMRSPTIRAMAVLPLENLSGDANEDYFADGTTDELITELARIPNVRIAALNSMGGRKEAQMSLRQIADQLHVDAVVEGSVLRSGDQVRINARLVDVRNDRHLWSESFEGKADDILGLEHKVAQEIASHAELAVEPQSASDSGSNRKINPAAHDAYLRGLYYYDQLSVGKSAEAFQAAVNADPTYAAAYAGLAMATMSTSFGDPVKPKDVAPSAIAYGHKAIELDPKLGQGYIALGYIDVIYTWDWPSAEGNLVRGLELSPNDTQGALAYSVYLDSVGRTDDAVKQMQRAVEIEPLSFFMVHHLGSALYFARRYDEALSQLQHAREMESPDNDIVDSWLSWAYEKKGMYDEAVKSDLSVLAYALSPAEITRLRSTYEKRGWKEYWQARLELMPGERETPCSFYESGVGSIRLGDRDKAFEALNQAAERRCFLMAYVMVDPLLDDLRADPRFPKLMARMNLPPAGGQP